mmetsp:Transcript_96694/g.268897  ORF Transcript_96694/g.268897 Transcript_96694/m.268897 type:complete len:89 (-) Transcript_96694:4-270(-)
MASGDGHPVVCGRCSRATSPGGVGNGLLGDPVMLMPLLPVSMRVLVGLAGAVVAGELASFPMPKAMPASLTLPESNCPAARKSFKRMR